jgi:hypothetical protein
MIGRGIQIPQRKIFAAPAEDLVFLVQGQASGTPTDGTLIISATDDIDVEAAGSLNIVSVTRSNDAGFRRHDVVISIPNNESGNLVFKDKHKIRSYGNHRGGAAPNATFYTGVNTTAPILNWNLNDIPSGVEKIRQSTVLSIILPTTGNEAMPTGLTYLFLNGGNINWTYTGAMPTGLTSLQLSGGNINWTGTTFGRDTAPFTDFGTFVLQNYRNPGDNLTSAELITMCQNLMNRCGNLPNINIREYDLNPSIAAIQGATPDEFGTTEEQIRYWIEQVKNKAPGTRTFTLNTTSI